MIRVPPTVRDTAEFVHAAVREYGKRTSWAHFSKNLTGACAMASWALVRALHWRGYKDAALEMANDSHVWVRIVDTVVDVTAEQMTGKRAVAYARAGRGAYKAGMYGNSIRVSVPWVTSDLRQHGPFISRMLRKLRTLDCTAVLEAAAS